MKVGDEIYKLISLGSGLSSNVPPQKGTVVYIHPRGRFYSVRFVYRRSNGEERSFRESYPLRNRILNSYGESSKEYLDDKRKSRAKL